MRKLREALHARKIRKAEETIEQARVQEKQARTEMHTIFRDKIVLNWADVGLRIVTTWKESFREILVKLKLAKPAASKRVPWVLGDPDKNTKHIRKNFLTQRSSLPGQGEKSTTEFFD
jgi:hypothetical protein